MDIEIKFDQWTYANKVLYTTKHAPTVEKFLQNFIASKFGRGYRLRVIPDYSDHTVEIQSPCAERFRAAKRALRDHFSRGFVREIKFKNKWQMLANEIGKGWKS